MALPVKTIYLVPHSHTDIGYTHDPVICWELHDRFLDRAIVLCEATAEMAPASAFHWTVEVFATLEHWWSYRSEEWHTRLRAAIERQQICVGARYTNGTMLHTYGDIQWELSRALEWATDQKVPMRDVMQNDVNGFSLAYADAMAHRGLRGLMMGLNTTMGHSPSPRPAAWRWQMPSGGELLTWHGWTYNYLRSFLDLDKLATELPDKLDELLLYLPEDYPFDFVAISATVNDNIGPFATLPEQVRRFNEAGHDVKLVVTTLSGFMDVVERHRESLPVVEGEWSDCWVFGHGAIPQEVAAVRRAQRRLEAVERIRGLGWADADGGTLSYNRARRHVALACEHTNGSHAATAAPESTDTQRQSAQLKDDFWIAESVSMALLRDHLQETAGNRSVAEPSALLINPFPVALNFRATYEIAGLYRSAQDRVSEQLYQLDREPTRQAMEEGELSTMAPVEPETALLMSLVMQQPEPQQQDVDMDQVIEFGDDLLRVSIDPSEGGIVSLITTADNHEWCVNDTAAMFSLVREVPDGEFMLYEPRGIYDPNDRQWRPEMVLDRQRVGHVDRVEWVSDRRGEALVMHSSGSPLRRQTLRFDPLLPGVLDLTADFWFEADCTRQAFYFPFGFWLEAGEPVRFFYDSSDLWLQADAHQLPGAARTFYEAGKAIAVEQGERSVTIASRDLPLWQFGGYTFGDPSRELSQNKPFVASWIYNNYWFCNASACSPGGFSCRYLIMPSSSPADQELSSQLAWQFTAEELVHPLVPRPDATS